MELITVMVGSEVTVFAYDAYGQRVMTVEPDGTVIYTPFSTYEEEVASGGATTTRSYYLLGGHVICLISAKDVSGYWVLVISLRR